MREIKFRAWDKGNKQMCYNISTLGWDSTGRIDLFEGQRGTGGAAVLWDSEFVIMQFTGLLDKNGKEIYEGDIISGGLKCESCVVSWDSTCGRFIARGNLYKVLGHKFRMFEIIGNIHENPELLEGLS